MDWFGHCVEFGCGDGLIEASRDAIVLKNVRQMTLSELCMKTRAPCHVANKWIQIATHIL